MKDILSEIIAHKQTEIELQKQTVSPEQLQEQAGIIIRENAAHHRSMKQALAASFYRNHLRVQTPFTL